MHHLERVAPPSDATPPFHVAICLSGAPARRHRSRRVALLGVEPLDVDLPISADPATSRIQLEIAVTRPALLVFERMSIRRDDVEIADVAAGGRLVTYNAWPCRTPSGEACVATAGGTAVIQILRSDAAQLDGTTLSFRLRVEPFAPLGAADPVLDAFAHPERDDGP